MSTLGNIVNKTNDVYLYTLTPAGDRLSAEGPIESVDSMANFLAFLKTPALLTTFSWTSSYQDDHSGSPGV